MKTIDEWLTELPKDLEILARKAMKDQNVTQRLHEESSSLSEAVIDAFDWTGTKKKTYWSMLYRSIRDGVSYPTMFEFYKEELIESLKVT